jgi:hypothetical protein
VCVCVFVSVLKGVFEFAIVALNAAASSSSGPKGSGSFGYAVFQPVGIIN